MSDENDNYKDTWNLFYKLKSISNDTNNSLYTSDIFKCTSCNNIEYNELNVCTNCGLVKYDNITDFNSHVYDNNCINNENTTTQFVKKNYYTNSRLYKMNVWYSWTNDEKTIYKLTKYTKELCEKLEVYTHLDYICDIVAKLFTAIKKDDGTKRSRVKDGLIIMCVYYVHRSQNLNLNLNFSTHSLAKKINLNSKYICKAEKIVLELINKNKVPLDKNVFFDYNKKLSNITFLKQMSIYIIPDQLYDEVDTLIKYCEKNELLIEHTPLSINIGCFYYILMKNNYDVNINDFSKNYMISCITTAKVFHKLVNLKLN
jgi:hypothetical protein